MAKCFEASAVSDLVTLVTRRIHCEGMREGIYFESGVVFRGLLYWCYRQFPLVWSHHKMKRAMSHDDRGYGHAPR